MTVPTTVGPEVSAALPGLRSAVEIACQALELVREQAAAGAPPPCSGTPGAPALVPAKVRTESALLLHVLDRIEPSDFVLRRWRGDLRSALDRCGHGDLEERLILEPGQALDHAAAVLLADRDADGRPRLRALVDAAVSAGLPGPERLPHRDLEQCWLESLRTGDVDQVRVDHALTASALGRPLDVLGCGTDDLYAFTHAVLYATGVGRRSPTLPRPMADVLADARAGLALALDADNYDLAAELAWTWTLLGRPDDAVLILALDVLAAVHREHGFLPGPGYRADAPEPDHRVRSSYHTGIVYGLLCALRWERPPAGPAVPDPGTSLPARIGTEPTRLRPAAWEKLLGSTGTAGPGGLVLTAHLRRARDRHDLAALRDLLVLAVEHDLDDEPAARQAAGLLRRAAGLF